MTLLLLESRQSNALDLELGIGVSENPLYTRVSCDNLPEHCNNRLVGKIAIYHNFNITNELDIKVWLDHYSLLLKDEVNPDSFGKNIAGASLVFKLF